MSVCLWIVYPVFVAYDHSLCDSEKDILDWDLGTENRKKEIVEKKRIW